MSIFRAEKLHFIRDVRRSHGQVWFIFIKKKKISRVGEGRGAYVR